MLDKFKIASNLVIYFYHSLQSRMFLYFLIILVLIEGIVPSFQLILLQELINFNSPHATPLLITLSLYALLIFTDALLNTIIPFIKKKLGEEAIINNTLQIFDIVGELPGMSLYEDEKHQYELATLKDLTSWLPLQIIEFSHKTIVLGVTTIALFIVLCKLSTIIAIALILSPWPYAILRYQFSYLEWEYDSKFAKDRKRLSYTRDLFLSRSAIKELKIFDTAYYFQNIYNQTFKRVFSWYTASQKKYIKKLILKGVWIPIVATTSLIYLFQKKDLSLGELALYLGSVLALTNIIQELVTNGAEALDLWGRYKIFYQFIHSHSYTQTLDKKTATKQTDLTNSSSELTPITVEFKQVTFCYNQHTGKVLDDISFTIPANTTVAIVGENGSGKSTIVKLLCSLYKPQSGQILINQQLLTEYNAGYWNQKLGVVFQQFGKYDLTIAENIAFEKAHTAGLDIQTITKQIELDHTIQQYCQGYETVLGPHWGGKNLSGGEWQKIALARALIRNVGLLIFDEPTSALDIETEYKLVKKIQSFKTKKTILLISHRFSTVQLADKIIVLDQHKIVETGTHEELMKYQGKYATMFKYQTKTA